MNFDITLLIIVIVILFIIAKLIPLLTRAVINSIVGFVLLFITNAMGITNISVDVISFLVCAVGGIPGALILIALNIFGIY